MTSLPRWRESDLAALPVLPSWVCVFVYLSRVSFSIDLNSIFKLGCFWKRLNKVSLKSKKKKKIYVIHINLPTPTVSLIYTSFLK